VLFPQTVLATMRVTLSSRFRWLEQDAFPMINRQQCRLQGMMSRIYTKVSAIDSFQGLNFPQVSWSNIRLLMHVTVVADLRHQRGATNASGGEQYGGRPVWIGSNPRTGAERCVG
jgi:hypothetical protein